MFEWIKGNGSRKRRDFGNFKFSLKSQPEIIDSSSTISLIAYSNSFGNAAIPCVYRWSIIKNGVRVSRPQFKGTTYKCEPSDVGAVIQAEVESTDMEYGGTAIVQFNPVQMDPNIKPQVQQSLIAGAFSSTVHVIQGIQERQCFIRISEQSIKIKHNYSQASFQFEYSVNEPQTQCLIKSSSGVVVNFIGKYRDEVDRFISALFDYPFKSIQDSVVKTTNVNKALLQNKNVTKCIELKFPSHGVRDIFLFIWKALAANKQVKKPRSSSISYQIPTKITPPTTSSNNFNYYMSEIQSLKQQLHRMSQVNKQHQKQRQKNLIEIQNLKSEIKTIIKNYTAFIEQKLQQRTEYNNNSVLSINEEGNLSKRRYKTLENQNNHLNSRIYALTKQIDIIRFQPLKIQSTGQSMNNSSLHHQLNNNQQFHNQLGNSIKIQQNTGKSVNGSPFSKKKTTDDQSQDFINHFDDCSASRISYLSSISSIHENTQLQQQSRINNNEKKQLEQKLQRSYQRISQLEGQLWKAQVELNYNNQKLTQSAVNLTSNNNNTNNYNKKLALGDVRQLRNFTHNQKPHVRNLNDEFDKIDNRNICRSQSVYQSNNSISIIKTEKKQPCFDDMMNKLQLTNQKLVGQKQTLIKKIQSLLQQNKKLMEENQLLKKVQPQINMLQGKIKTMQQEILMYQKNMDALNRSQQFSIDSNSFNDQQMEMLKKQNDFLTNQNVKLTKACQKYMTEAKQSNKLRLQLTKMRSRIITEKLS